ncbi:class I SAM-dependent methyltransferase [Lysobacter sp. A286]
MSRNLEWSSHLEDALLPHHKFKSVVDIGCGIGTWIHYLASKGYQAFGFDPGEEAASFGNNNLSVRIHAGYFSSETAKALCGSCDLVTCIMVLEHLRQPRDLIKEIAKYCISTGAMAYVSVPFYYGSSHLKVGSEFGASSVFNSTSAHVTYFSETGMKRAFSEFGMTSYSISKIVPASNSWAGFLFRTRQASGEMRRK